MTETALEQEYRVSEYTHSGHPDVASQYSQGWFSVGTETAQSADEVIDGYITGLRQEGIAATDANADDAGGMSGSRNGKSWEVTVDSFGDDATDVTLTVLHLCVAEDHSSPDCECYEYCHAYQAMPV